MARAIARAGGTANQITVLAMVGSTVVGGLIYLFPAERWPLILVGPWLFVRMALNAIDGMLAREYGQKSALGGILNELGDVVSDAALYLPFACVTGFDARPRRCGCDPRNAYRNDRRRLRADRRVTPL